MPLTHHATDSGVTVVHVDGQLVIANRNELKELLAERLAAGDRRFVLDFSHTGYIDSSGLGALVTSARRVREQGGDLRLAALNDDLRTLFELTKLDTLFAIAATPAQAIAAF
ncbi:MAG: STAS domain-containing protein [Gemmatimonadales bacterium]|jgi:anti-sigma B factor antagonist|nr:STAS domain-containing protein [Gemmatimonadales bacterium]